MGTVYEVDANGDLTCTGEMKGSRQVMGAGNNGLSTVSAYLKGFNGMPMDATKGWRMIRNGSIVGVSLQSECTAVTVSGPATIEVRKNGVNVFSASVTISGLGITGTQATQARNVDTFVAGDVITLYLTIGGTFTLDDTTALVEFQLDT